MVLPLLVEAGVTGASVSRQRAPQLAGTGQVIEGARLGASEKLNQRQRTTAQRDPHTPDTRGAAACQTHLDRGVSSGLPPGTG